MPLSYPLAFPLGDPTVDLDNRIVRLLKAWVSTLQGIENTLQDMLSQKNVDNAVGAQLDLLGKVVGQARGGRTDADYRRFIRAKVKVNKSNGIYDDILQVSVLVLNNVAYTLKSFQNGPATMTLLIQGVALPMALAQILSGLLQKTKSAGVRLETVFNSEPNVGLWFYSDDNACTTEDSFLFDSLPQP